jgi:hypothetical protein
LRVANRSAGRSAGNTWRIQSEGVYPDGRLFSSTDTLRFVGDNPVRTSRHREVDEQPLPDVGIHFARQAKDR